MAASYFLGTRTFTSKKGSQCYKLQLQVLNRFGDWEIKDYFLAPDSEVWSMASLLSAGSAVRTVFDFSGDLTALDEDKTYVPLNLNVRKEKGGV